MKIKDGTDISKYGFLGYGKTFIYVSKHDSGNRIEIVNNEILITIGNAWANQDDIQEILFRLGKSSVVMEDKAKCK
jgi:hypothetical protein